MTGDIRKRVDDIAANLEPGIGKLEQRQFRVGAIVLDLQDQQTFACLIRLRSRGHVQSPGLATKAEVGGGSFTTSQ